MGYGAGTRCTDLEVHAAEVIMPELEEREETDHMDVVVEQEELELTQLEAMEVKAETV